MVLYWSIPSILYSSLTMIIQITAESKNHVTALKISAISPKLHQWNPPFNHTTITHGIQFFWQELWIVVNSYHISLTSIGLVLSWIPAKPVVPWFKTMKPTVFGVHNILDYWPPGAGWVHREECMFKGWHPWVCPWTWSHLLQLHFVTFTECAPDQWRLLCCWRYNLLAQ